MFEQTSQSQSTSSSCAHTVDSRIGAFGVLDGVSLSLDIAFFDRCQLASLLTPIFDVQLGSDSPLLKLPCFDKYFTMTDSLLVVDIVPSKENSNGTTCRPVTRQYLKKERQKAQKSENLELRRSNRDHNRIRVKGGTPFYRRLHILFFESRKSKKDWTSVGDHARLHLRRVHSLRTSIYEINNFLSDTELNYFKDFIQTCPFQKSYVDNMHFGTDQGNSPNKRQRRTILDDSHRTSTFFGFKHRADPTIRAIEQRTADLLGCWIHQIEGLQLVRYLEGQFFGVHHDMGELLEDDQVVLPKKEVGIKRRLVTIFVYLNDLEINQGGCTYFPKCNDLRVRPKEGMAILWSNVASDGNPDPNTIHAGEPVIGTKEVVKYGLNIWITEE